VKTFGSALEFLASPGSIRRAVWSSTGAARASARSAAGARQGKRTGPIIFLRHGDIRCRCGLSRLGAGLSDKPWTWTSCSVQSRGHRAGSRAVQSGGVIGKSPSWARGVGASGEVPGRHDRAPHREWGRAGGCGAPDPARRAAPRAVRRAVTARTSGGAARVGAVGYEKGAFTGRVGTADGSSGRGRHMCSRCRRDSQPCRRRSAGVRSFSYPNSSDSSSARVRAVQRDERALGAARRAVDQARHNLLAVRLP